jgi:hypothetical protein
VLAHLDHALKVAGADHVGIYLVPQRDVDTVAVRKPSFEEGGRRWRRGEGLG